MGRITKSPTVGTIEVGRREMIEQIESFPPASDHIPNDGKKVVGDSRRVKLRHSASALPVGGRVGAGATAWGCGLFNYPHHPDTRRGFSFTGRGRCAPGFFVGNCDGWWREERASALLATGWMK